MKTTPARFGSMTPGVAGLLLLACAGGDAGGTAVVRDSAGVAIVENEPPGEATPQWRVGPQQQVIGRAEGSEGETLYRVVGALRQGERVVVANAGTAEVRWYDAAGSLVASAGRQGGGPGEFTRLAGLVAVSADTVGAVDGASGRVTLYAGAGTVVGEVLPPRGPPVNVLGRLPDGRWIGWIVALSPSMEEGLARPEVALGVYRPGAGEADTVGRWPGAERVVRVNRQGTTIRSIELTTPPFARTTTFAVHDGMLHVGTQDAPEIRVHDAAGTLLRIVRTGASMPVVTPELTAAWIERRVASLPADRRAASAEAFANTPTGERVPPYGPFRVDRAGRLWVQDYPGLADAAGWSVFDEAGALLARIALPAGFTPYDIGDSWILGRETDELDVEQVRLYPIERDG